MKEKLEQLLAEGKQRIASVATETELQDIKAALLGKQGSLTELMKELPKLDVSLRPEMGKAVNQVKGRGVAGTACPSIRPCHGPPANRCPCSRGRDGWGGSSGCRSRRARW